MNTCCSLTSPVSRLRNDDVDEERRLVGHVLLLALLDGVLGVPELVRAELHREVPGEVFDRRDVLEGLVQTFLEEPLETVALKRDETGYVEYLRDLREGTALAKTSLDNTGIGSTGHQVIPPPVVGH